MINVTLRQMRYADALARHAHFGRAASACAISQPALSAQLRTLEQALGRPLFERSARHVRLTAFGEEALARMRAVLGAVEGLDALARTAGRAMPERLRLGVIPTIAPYLLPQILRRLAELHPDLGIRVRETITPRLLEAVAEGRLDCALLALPVSEVGLAELALFEEPLCFVRPAGEAGAPAPRVATLDPARLLLLEEGHCFRDQALSLCAGRPAGERDALDGSALGTLVQMVAAGLGTTLVPAMAAAVEARSAAVDVVRFDGPEPVRRVGLVWRRESPLAPAFRALGAVVASAAPAAARRLEA